MLPKFIVTISVLACLATRAFAGCAIAPDGNGNAAKWTQSTGLNMDRFARRAEKEDKTTIK